jgi:branched-chain amino acid transport system permease protein
MRVRSVKRVMRSRAIPTDIRLLRTTRQRILAIIVAAAAIGVPFLLQLNLSLPYSFPWQTWMTVIDESLVMAVAACGFGILVGRAGLISVAQAGLLALGATVAGIAGVLWGMPFGLVLIIAAAAGAVVGILTGVPALRVKGLYLFVATLSIYYILLFFFEETLSKWFQYGEMQMRAVEVPIIGVLNSDFRWYWILLPISCIWLIGMANLVRSRYGRAMSAVKEGDAALALVGVRPYAVKLTTFVVTSAMVTFAGALLTYYLSVAGETDYSFQLLLNYAIIIVVGGFGSIQGAIFGTFFFNSTTVLISWLTQNAPGISSISFLQTNAADVELAVFGLLVVLILMFWPSGLAGAWGILSRRDYRLRIGTQGGQRKGGEPVAALVESPSSD